jgi:hypothetical protein
LILAKSEVPLLEIALSSFPESPARSIQEYLLTYCEEMKCSESLPKFDEKELNNCSVSNIDTKFIHRFNSSPLPRDLSEDDSKRRQQMISRVLLNQSLIYSGYRIVRTNMDIQHSVAGTAAKMVDDEYRRFQQLLTNYQEVNRMALSSGLSSSFSYLPFSQYIDGPLDIAFLNWNCVLSLVGLFSSFLKLFSTVELDDNVFLEVQSQLAQFSACQKGISDYLLDSSRAVIVLKGTVAVRSIAPSYIIAWSCFLRVCKPWVPFLLDQLCVAMVKCKSIPSSLTPEVMCSYEETVSDIRRSWIQTLGKSFFSFIFPCSN